MMKVEITGLTARQIEEKARFITEAMGVQDFGIEVRGHQTFLHLEGI